MRDWAAVKRGHLEHDPYNTFDRVMDVVEANGLRSAFYLLAGDSFGAWEGSYRLSHQEIRDLIRKVHDRGHEIGLHGTYESYASSDRLARERTCLFETCRRLGVSQQIRGGRQHFLRWTASSSFRDWEEAGFDYDSTLAYSKRAGFRTGSCYPYRTFDLLRRQRLRLVERPLILMECSVIDGAGSDPGSAEAALEQMVSLRDTCRRFRGDFVLLWHNSRLTTSRDWEMFEALLR